MILSIPVLLSSTSVDSVLSGQNACMVCAGRTNVLRIDSATANPPRAHTHVLQGEEHCSIHWGKYSS